MRLRLPLPSLKILFLSDEMKHTYISVCNKQIVRKFFTESDYVSTGRWKKYHTALLKDMTNYMKKVRNVPIFVEENTFKLIRKTFSLTDGEVRLIVKYPKLGSCSNHEICKTVAFLKEEGVTGKHLCLGPWLLWQTSEDLMIRKNLIHQLELFENHLDGTGFLFFPPELIRGYKVLFDNEKKREYPYYHRNRLYYICDKLKLPVDFFTLKVVIAWKTMHKNKVQLDKVIQVLQEYEILPEHILADIWVLDKSPSVVRQRFSCLSEITRAMKPWVGRCSLYNFQRHYLNVRFNGSALGPYRDIYHLVASELDLGVEHIREVFLNRSISPLSYEKIANNLKSLKSMGFSKKQIWDNLPILLQCSPKTIQERMTALQDVGLEAGNIKPISFISSKEGFWDYWYTCKLHQEGRLTGVKEYSMSLEDLYKYIACELHCSVDSIEDFFSRTLRLRQTSSKKIRQNLQVLKEVGFTNEQIRGNLGALSMTTSWIEKRMQRFQEIGLAAQDITLATLMRSEEEFCRSFARYKRKCVKSFADGRIS